MAVLGIRYELLVQKQPSYNRSLELRKKINEKQLKELLNRKTYPVTNNSIPGYTWYHQENVYLDCVKSSVHNSVSHTGLCALNGGGTTLR